MWTIHKCSPFSPISTFNVLRWDLRFCLFLSTLRPNAVAMCLFFSLFQHLMICYVAPKSQERKNHGHEIMIWNMQMHCCGPSNIILSHCRLLLVAVYIPMLLGELLRCLSAGIPSLFRALSLASATSFLNKHVLNPDPRLLTVISTSRPRLKILCAYRWERTVSETGMGTTKKLKEP